MDARGEPGATDDAAKSPHPPSCRSKTNEVAARQIAKLETKRATKVARLPTLLEPLTKALQKEVGNILRQPTACARGSFTLRFLTRAAAQSTVPPEVSKYG